MIVTVLCLRFLASPFPLALAEVFVFPVVSTALLQVVLMSSLTVVVEERAAELRHIVGHLLQCLDGLAVCLRQRTEDGHCSHALAEQLTDVRLSGLL